LNPFDDDDDDVDDNDRKDEGNEKGERLHIEDTIASAVKGVPSRSMNPFDPAYIYRSEDFHVQTLVFSMVELIIVWFRCIIPLFDSLMTKSNDIR
jgi:hypothetical protein